MHSPKRCRGARRAWRRLKRRGVAGRSKPSERPRKSGHVGPRPRRRASARGKNVAVDRRSQGTRGPRTKRREAAAMPSGPACGQPPQVGSPGAMRKPVWRRRARSSGPVTGQMQRTTSNKQHPGHRRRLRRLRTQVLRGQRRPGVRLRRSWRRWTRGMTVRPRPRRWRREGVIPPWRPVVCPTMARLQRRLRRHAQPRSAWRLQCAVSRVVRCTPGARSSWHRCVVRAKQGGVAVALRCEASRRFAAHGVGCA
jgi:hypothetical protein